MRTRAVDKKNRHLLDSRSGHSDLTDYDAAVGIVCWLKAKNSEDRRVPSCGTTTLSQSAIGQHCSKRDKNSKLQS